MNAVMNKAEIAELFGVTVRTIHNWAALGWLVRSGRGYDVAASVRSVTKALQAAVAGRSNDSKLVEANVASRGRLAAAQARSVELRNKIAEGSMLPAADVEARWGAIMVEIRAAMLALPSRAGMRLPHLSSYDISEIDREVREVLTEMSG
jgi:phage terminase Nu1 subunit (DNA packaging protein)